MDATEAQIKEKLEICLKQATEIAAQLRAIEQGDRVPHYDEIELPAHEMGQRFSRAIQEERARELALREFKVVAVQIAINWSGSRLNLGR